MMKKNITFINTNKAWGGGEKWHFEAAIALRKLGHKCSIICYPDSALQKKCVKEKIQYTTLKTTNLSFLNPLLLWKTFIFLRQNSTEILFLNLPIDVKISAILAPLYKKFLGVEKIIYRRGMPAPIQNTFLNRYLYSKVDAIIANSLEIKNSIIKNIPLLKNKVFIIYNGVLSQGRSTKILNSNHTIKIGNLGRLVEQKGQKHLIGVAIFLRKKNINFHLSIAGNGPLKEELQRLIKYNELETYVSLVGHVDSDVFLSSIDIFIFPSHFEGSANAIIEAFQYGIPSLSFNISSMPEMITDYQTGFLIEPFDEAKMANKIIKLIQSPDLYTQMSTQCLEVINDKFNYNLKIKQVEDLMYEK